MYDEKWFWVFLMRRGAKACEELGVKEKYFQSYHKNHIHKVMTIAFTLFVFVEYVENGGSAENLALIRYQYKKVVSKMKIKYVNHPDGRIIYLVEVFYGKVDVYHDDRAVTGSKAWHSR